MIVSAMVRLLVVLLLVLLLLWLQLDDVFDDIVVSVVKVEVDDADRCVSVMNASSEFEPFNLISLLSRCIDCTIMLGRYDDLALPTFCCRL